MANLVVCCDGTWNTPDQEDNGQPAPTNVFKLNKALAEVDADGVQQEPYYRPGVGSSGGLWDRIKGGGLGVGLSDDIKSAYKWLCERYDPDRDRIYLFGFSRGAYAVRSLAGLIGGCGLLKLGEGELSEAKKWRRVETTYQAYRSKNSRTVESLDRYENVEVNFLGVWDTVGALGIPDELFINVLDRPRKFQFHDTDLGEHVRVARHAVSIDEKRQTFTPTLWAGPHEHRDIVEEWFAGVHGDVGGSYANSGLGDVSLQWMIDEAKKAGLSFEPSFVAQINPQHMGVLHDSVKGVFAKLRTRPRSAPDINGPNVHESAKMRSAEPPLIQPDYWPTKRLKAGESHFVDIYAKERWNRTNLFLEEGVEYEFRAEGEWLDASIRCNPDGPAPGFQWGTLFFGASAISDRLQRYYRSRPGGSGTIVRGARREQDMPWFCLVGAIGNGVGVDVTTQKLNPHEAFRIGSSAVHRPTKSGYLYCFANDVWSFYFNNKGSVRLTVSRL